MLFSCYKDLSTKATLSLPEIVIEGNGGVINVSYGDDFVFEPVVTQEGYTVDDFSFLWEIDLQANYKNNRIELGQTQKLEYKVGNMPSNKPYTLSLKVTNNKLGFSYVGSWSMYVSSSLGEGLLVANTRDNGATTDLDLVSYSPITFGYTGDTPHYARSLFALGNNGNKIQGKVNSMAVRVTSNGAVFNDSAIILGTDNAIFTINPLTYKENRRNGEMFNNTDETNFSTSSVFNFATVVNGALVNKVYYVTVTNADYMFNKAAVSFTPGDIFYPDNISYAKLDQGSLCVFNQNDSKFYYMRGWMSMTGSFTPITASPSFDIAGALSMGGGALKDLTHGFIIKDASNVRHLCIINVDDPSIKDYTINDADISDAVDFAFCDNANIIYYATPNKIHVLTLSGDVLTSSTLSWTPDSSAEKITSIEQYTQGWYGTQQIWLNNYDFTLITNRMQIIITTYNESTGEGKIYLRPFNINTGKFTFSSNGTFNGFGKITAVTPTLR